MAFLLVLRTLVTDQAKQKIISFQIAPGTSGSSQVEHLTLSALNRINQAGLKRWWLLIKVTSNKCTDHSISSLLSAATVVLSSKDTLLHTLRRLSVNI